MTAPTWLSPEAAAIYLDVTTRTLTAWRVSGGGPSYARLGKRNGRVRYDRRALDAWMEMRMHEYTGSEQDRRPAA